MWHDHIRTMYCSYFFGLELLGLIGVISPEASSKIFPLILNRFFIFLVFEFESNLSCGPAKTFCRKPQYLQAILGNMSANDTST